MQKICMGKRRALIILMAFLGLFQTFHGVAVPQVRLAAQAVRVGWQLYVIGGWDPGALCV